MDARTPNLEKAIPARGWRPDRCDRIALVLQGGALSKNVPSAKNLILNLVSTDAFLARLP